MVLPVNLGSGATSGPITVKITLPPGLTTAYPPAGSDEGSSFGEWLCETEAGPEEIISCVSESNVGPLRPTPAIGVPVVIDPGASGPVVARAEISGGSVVGTSETETAIELGASPLSFGPLGSSFSAAALNPVGALDTEAGSHPAGLTAQLAFPSVMSSSSGVGKVEPLPRPVEYVRQIVTDLPAGLVGDALAAPTCSLADVSNLAAEETQCPTSTQIGKLGLVEAGGAVSKLTVFNVTPERGFPAEFAVFLPTLQRTAVLYASVVGSGADTHIRVISAPQDHLVEIVAVTLTLFGQPAVVDNSPLSSVALATNPSDCSAPGFTTTLHVDSWEHPGGVNPDGTPNFADSNWKAATFESPPVTGCELLQFKPSVSFNPESSSSDSPTGLAVNIHIPQNEDPNGLATPPLREATVSLPRGMAVNPSSADGLAACTPAQIAASTNDPGACPQASQIGEVEIKTPLLDHPLPGKVYLGTPDCAPCSNVDAQTGKLVKLYIEVNDPLTGVIVKLPGSGSLDPATGQVTASFKENPQVPFEDFNLHFKGGQRATLTTPSVCGHFTTTTDLKPWSAPRSGPDATPQSSFDLTSGPGGSACASSESQLPNRPAFEAGTTNPIAGAYSPFVLKLSREDGSQRISSIDTTLPEGLLGKLAGVPYCSDAAISAAASKSGNAEKSSPSCPLASEVGVVTVGAGSGAPFYVQGHAYLAGPYKGAPLSLAIITPAVAGPFDLGTVVVRAALFVNQETTQIHAVSDPIPSILAGIPLDVRTIGLNMNRPDFTLNPTSCDPMSVLGSATSILGQTAGLSNRFQVGGCGGLAFKPKLNIKLKGSTKRAGTPALRATLTYPKGAYANIASASVALPHSEFLDQAHIKTICTRVQFAQGNTPGERCPAGSIYGHARAITPLLDQPLEGPVYLRSSSHPLPDLVAALNGQIQVVLDGTIDSVHGGIRNRFEMVPDAPVSKFTLTMQGGKKGLLENSTNLCRSTNKATVNLTAQNGKVYDTEPVVGNSCKKKHGKGKKKASRRVGSSRR